MRLRGMVRKESLQILRDPSSIAIAFVMPVVLLLLFGYGVSLDAKHIPLAQSGTYTLQWANPGGAKRLRFAFDLKANGGGRRDHLFGIPSGTSPTAPDIWEPALSGRAGYVGSAACGKKA